MSGRLTIVHQDVPLSTGIRVHVASRRGPAGPVLLLLPAYADSWISFSPLMAVLREEIRTLAVDQRGHGDSDRPHCCYDVPSFADDVVAVLDALELERATLVGHSGSCLIARRVAETHPTRVDGLVLIASPLVIEADRIASFRDEVDALADPVPEDFVRRFQRAATSAALPDDFFGGLVAASRKVPARVWRAALRGLLGFDDRAELSQSTVNSLLLWGDQDSIVDRSAQEALVGLIPGARLEIYAGIGHSPNWERPDLVARSVEAFADRRVAS
jgi:pimeloyl-ACP methyl ester carboxylesterase